jgi:hypothetical protein
MSSVAISQRDWSCCNETDRDYGVCRDEAPARPRQHQRSMTRHAFNACRVTCLRRGAPGTGTSSGRQGCGHDLRSCAAEWVLRQILQQISLPMIQTREQPPLLRGPPSGQESSKPNLAKVGHCIFSLHLCYVYIALNKVEQENPRFDSLREPAEIGVHKVLLQKKNPFIKSSAVHSLAGNRSKNQYRGRAHSRRLGLLAQEPTHTERSCAVPFSFCS